MHATGDAAKVAMRNYTWKRS